MSGPTRALLILVVALASRSAAAQSGGASELPRLASLASRDAKIFIAVEDRQAFLRRCRRTAIARALRLADEAPARAIADVFAAQIAPLLPAGVMSDALALLDRGRGSVAVSFDGFRVAGDEVVPDILVVADESGFEDLLPALRGLAQGDESARDRLAALDLPFGPVDPRGVTLTWHRSVDLIQFDCGNGQGMVLASMNGLLFGASSAEPVTRALDRALDPSVGTLLDNRRFLGVWHDLDPRPGALFAYADLRRLRQDASFLGGRRTPLRTLIAESLSEFDGLALGIRGVGETFSAEAFLEAGALTFGGGDRVEASERSFTIPGLLPAGAPMMSVCTASLAEVGDVLDRAVALNVLPEGARLGALLADGGGDAADPPLADMVGGEFGIFQFGARHSGEFFPRIGWMLEVQDANGLRARFERAAKRDGRAVRRLPYSVPSWEIAVDGRNKLGRPAVAVLNRFVVGANSSIALRELLEVIGSEDRLSGTEAYLAPHDRLDVRPGDPAVFETFVDTATVARTIGTWTILMQTLPFVALDAFDEGITHEQVKNVLAAILLLSDDPDVRESLRGICVRGTRHPRGLLVHAIGP